MVIDKNYDITTEELTVTEQITVKEKQLILYNDDVNTFDFVIDTLINVCNHELEQAVQCTYLIHYTGKCAVKAGSYEKLNPLCSALADRGLGAVIE